MERISLTQNKFALVDDEDYDFLMQYNWYLHISDGKEYAARSIKIPKRKIIYMHRFIITVSDKSYVDHIDGDGLNNKRSNLREVSNAQNQMNTKSRNGTTSQYKGVSWNKKCGSWVAFIRIKKIHTYIGKFQIEEDAAKAYNHRAQKEFGEFARLNHLP